MLSIDYIPLTRKRRKNAGEAGVLREKHGLVVVKSKRDRRKSIPLADPVL